VEEILENLSRSQFSNLASPLSVIGFNHIAPFPSDCSIYLSLFYIVQNGWSSTCHPLSWLEYCSIVQKITRILGQRDKPLDRACSGACRLSLDFVCLPFCHRKFDDATFILECILFVLYIVLPDLHQIF